MHLHFVTLKSHLINQIRFALYFGYWIQAVWKQGSRCGRLHMARSRILCFTLLGNSVSISEPCNPSVILDRGISEHAWKWGFWLIQALPGKSICGTNTTIWKRKKRRGSPNLSALNCLVKGSSVCLGCKVSARFLPAVQSQVWGNHWTYSYV